MKNIKINDILKKISRNARLILLTTSIAVGLVGCENFSDKSHTTTTQKEIPNDQKTPTLDLSNPDSVDEAYYMEYYDAENGGIDQKEERRGYVREVTKNGKKYLVDSDDWNKVLISDYIKIGEPYCVDYYNSKSTDDSSYVIDVEKEDKIEVIDARNFGVLLTNLDYVDIENWNAVDDPEYMECYDAENGGKDNDNKESGYGNGYVYEVQSNDGRKVLLDASSFKVLLSGYDKRYQEEYMRYYDVENGGKDNDDKEEYGYGNGYVFEVERDCKKYLIDASHPRIILSAYDKMDDPFIIYDYAENDIDNRGAGYVQLITKDDVRYLVDANDWESILVEHYVSSSYDSVNYLSYLGLDYKSESILKSELKAHKSQVLTK